MLLMEWLLIVLTKLQFNRANQIKVVFFGAMNGRWYGDNAKHIFEYLERTENTDFRHYWVTRNSKICRELRKKGHPVLYQFSLRYLFALSRCELGVYTDSLRDILVNPMLQNIRLKTINLRHGRSVKRVRFARKNHQLSGSETKERRRETDLTAFATSTSDFISDIQEECLQLGRDRHIVTGYPRNDDLVRNGAIPRPDGPVRILYAPSWRHGRVPTRFFPFEGMDLAGFDAKLAQQGMEIHLRPHVGEINTASFPDLTGLKNIRLFDHTIQPDINSSLHEFDVLISDYSALVHDFLLLDRPVILVPYDYDNFNFESGFLYDYYENAPGIVVQSEIDFTKAILEREAFLDEYVVARRKLRDRIHQHQDDNSCRRVCQLIKDTIHV